MSWEVPHQRPWEHFDRNLDFQWLTFKKTHNKTYEPEEEIKRRLFWEDTLEFIREHNIGYDRGEHTYFVGENHLSDLAEDEYEKIYLTGLIVPEDKEEEEYPPALTEPDPTAEVSLDWSKRGLVSSVKNQGRCGSCWAFSALGALEGQHKKKKGVMTDLSEQNLVDCTRRYGNLGCRGGWMNTAFKYIKDNKGVDGEYCYPYRAADGFCQFRRSCTKAKNYAYKNVGKSEYSLRSAVSRVGPIAIAADVSGRGFGSYRGGVYNNPSCSTRYPNHAMLVVGYGRLGGRDYWKVKNSWGATWGKNGYVYMSRNRNNQCGIANFASYPVV